MRDAVTAYVGLGANLGDAQGAVLAAFDRLAALPDTALIVRSSLYCTAPVQAAGPEFVNAVAQVRTRLSAPDLLAALQRIELDAGRERPYRNAPRTLDLDLLLYGSARIASPALEVPHPRMRERGFVLVPLAEIAPQAVPAEWLAAVGGQSVRRVAPT
jgi:2-amino-4-hydroxy-6-hydroxymethyldihydropteridine diphosphokinase